MMKLEVPTGLPYIADIVTNVFFRKFMFVEWSSIKDHGNQKAKFAKNIQKSTPQKLYGG